MKAISLVTLSLHFFAVQILIGSLLAACWFTWRGRFGRDADRTAAAVLGRRLPIVMTSVITLGVPPLLFAQVLYGRVLYTSSVLIAVMWISVIFLLMAAYYGLYRLADETHAGKPALAYGLTSLVLIAGIGQIYSTNMTLMLRPEVWQQMYANTATGLQAPPHDPTTMPRWLFMMAGGLIGGGLWMMLHSYLSTIEEEARRLLRRTGGLSALVGILLQGGFGLMVYSRQGAGVQASLGDAIHRVSLWVWVGGLLVTGVISVIQVLSKAGKLRCAIIASVTAQLAIGGTVVYRDGIRDATLMAKGFDVWNRTEASNWSVIGLFLFLFVVGLGAVGWLLSVMKGASPVEERVA